MRKQQMAIIALALWLTLVSLFTVLMQQIDLSLFFILCLFGILIIAQFMQANYVQPAYLRRIRYLIEVGILIFSIIIALKVLDILGLEIVIL